jgi:hypothetical protein
VPEPERGDLHSPGRRRPPVAVTEVHEIHLPIVSTATNGRNTVLAVEVVGESEQLDGAGRARLQGIRPYRF